jgi:hypothetical protein
VEPVIESEVASIVVLPTARPVAKPAVVIVATEVLVEVQATEVVRFCVLSSLYVPVAVNCCPVPAGMEGLAGVTEIDTRDCPCAGLGTRIQASGSKSPARISSLLEIPLLTTMAMCMTTSLRAGF